MRRTRGRLADNILAVWLIIEAVFGVLCALPLIFGGVAEPIVGWFFAVLISTPIVWWFRRLDKREGRY